MRRVPGSVGLKLVNAIRRDIDEAVKGDAERLLEIAAASELLKPMPRVSPLIIAGSLTRLTQGQ